MFNWRFICPGCGHVQAVDDFKPYKESGATPNSASQECIGRYGGRRRDWMTGEGKGPCNYAGFGLFDIRPVQVVAEDGKVIRAFAFADEVAKESGVGA